MSADGLRRDLGDTGLRVHPICLGGNVFGWTVPSEAADDVLDAYYNLGGNFLDSANTYSRWVAGNQGGESELIIGAWMKRRKIRTSLTVATKVGSATSDKPSDQGLSRRHIHEQVDASLQRLQTDYIDLYTAHIDDRDTPLDETLGALTELIKVGKVRFLAASNYSAERLQSALSIGRSWHFESYRAIQPRYNLVDRDEFEGGLEEICRRERLGVFAYLGLANGFLTGKYRSHQSLPSSPRAVGVQSEYMNAKGFRVLQALDQVANRIGATDAQIALAWILAHPTITSTITSASRTAQVVELMAAADITLGQDDLEVLNHAQFSNDGQR